MSNWNESLNEDVSEIGNSRTSKATRLAFLFLYTHYYVKCKIQHTYILLYIKTPAMAQLNGSCALRLQSILRLIIKLL